MTSIIEVKNVSKSYPGVQAVDNVSFVVEEGEVFGILGPNGAGKTTTLEMIEGLRTPDAGSITVCGVDARRDLGKVKERIGVQLQNTAHFDALTVLETINLFRSCYRHSVSAERLLAEFALEEKRNARISQLSGGLKQRLAVAIAMVNDPDVVFLDEPTTGLDPQARLNFWDTVLGMKEEGKTVILTTHYMEEAERLSDRVAIMDHGRIIALDTPRALVRGYESAIECTIEGPVEVDGLRSVAAVSEVKQADGDYILYTRDLRASLFGLVELFAENPLAIRNLSVRPATLEDVFIALTGRRLRE